MKKFSYDDKEIIGKVFSSTPINKTALLVTSKGVNYQNPHPIRSHEIHSHTPLPTRKVPFHMKNKGHDLTGKIFNRLTVVGLALIDKNVINFKSIKRKGVSWVVRCCCGAYELRRTISLNQMKSPLVGMCRRCWGHELLRNEKKPSKKGTA